MRQNVLFVLAVVSALATVATTAAAQDRLESIASKPKIDDRDRARISTEVAERVRKLAEAGADADQRRQSRERLKATPNLKVATREFKEVYAEACARELAALVVSEVFENGLDAALTLEALKHVKTAEALASALRSIHAPVRLRAARGLQALSKELAADPQIARPILRALGEAGAVEAEPAVLRAIYQAIDQGAAAKDDQLADDGARALNGVLAGRLTRLAGGRRDEVLDERAIESAARFYAGASEAQKKQLLDNLSKWLRHAVERYFSSDTAEGYLPTLASLTRKAESSIHEMIKASKAKAPEKKVADALKKGGKREQAVAALNELQTVLKGEPWNLP